MNQYDNVNPRASDSEANPGMKAKTGRQVVRVGKCRGTAQQCSSGMKKCQTEANQRLMGPSNQTPLNARCALSSCRSVAPLNHQT